MCHPGFVDAELERLDPLTKQREREYAYLAGDDFPAVLRGAWRRAGLRKSVRCQWLSRRHGEYFAAAIPLP